MASLNRIPQPGEARANVHVGGRPVASELSERDIKGRARAGHAAASSTNTKTGLLAASRGTTRVPGGIPKYNNKIGANGFRMGS